MRWDVIKEAWKMAKIQFPEINRIYVKTPLNLDQTGVFQIFNLDDISKPCGCIKYDIIETQSNKKVKMVIGSQKSEACLSSVRFHNFRIDSKIDDFVGKINILPELEKDVAGIKTAANSEKFEDNERVRICGLPVTKTDDRIVPNPFAMQYQEMGQIITSTKSKKGRFYLILVDGSTNPQWFPEEAVCRSQVGGTTLEY